LHDATKITGIILCGGKSTRMGENKAFIQIDGIPIIQRIYLLFKTLFSEIMIVTNETESFMNFEAKIHRDLIPDRGALGGLYSGIFYASSPYAFCVACDMPFLKGPVIQYLLNQIEGHDVIVPKTKDGLQPLHAIYSKTCLDPIRATLEQGKYKITDFYPRVNVKTLDENEFRSLDPTMESFINVNTPAELLLMKTHTTSYKNEK
jgi:molybdopterin-guanine dinucleotide biosynthesis protein A